MSGIKRDVAKGTVLEERASLTAGLRIFLPIWVAIIILLWVWATFGESTFATILMYAWLGGSVGGAVAVGFKYLHLSLTKSEIDKLHKKRDKL